MEYEKFIIKNFKGIEEIELDLTKYPNGKIFPLVGLNEAGKTTILEAISFFLNDIEEEKRYELIHKRDRGFFSGEISIEAFLKLSQEERENIAIFLADNNLIVESPEKIPTHIAILKSYKYKDGNFETVNEDQWSFYPEEISVRKSSGSIYRDLYDNHNEVWNKLVENLEKKIPKILYFENFVFKFPEKIYLEELSNPTYKGEESIIQIQYRNVIEDILKSCNTSYDRHLLIRKLKSSVDAEIESGKQILREMEIALNQKILDPWNQIFPNTPQKRISIETNNNENGQYIQIKINEGSTSFYVDERSLGFRWFFGFILFTEFRKLRDGEDGEYLFLFDEPASNLHEGSQKKLLTLFENLTDKAKIIYSTHSPYLLNPKFLLNTFIVKDIGREVSNEFDYRQNIKVDYYKNFVSQNPNQESHFKPLLNVLEFEATDFDLSDKLVFFEGKFDYYTFKWMLNTQFQQSHYDFKLYPGTGVDSYENIFREYLAHNKKFIAVFDADSAGKNAKTRYINNISQELEKQIFTLKDINISFDNFTTEKLFTESEKLQIQKKSFSGDTSYNKGRFNTAIQELFIKNESIELSENTKENFKKIFEFIKSKFDELDN